MFQDRRELTSYCRILCYYFVSFNPVRLWSRTPRCVFCLESLRDLVKLGVDKTFCYENEVTSTSGSCRNSGPVVCNRCSGTRERFYATKCPYLNGLIFCSFYFVGVKMSSLYRKMLWRFPLLYQPQNILFHNAYFCETLSTPMTFIPFKCWYLLNVYLVAKYSSKLLNHKSACLGYLTGILHLTSTKRDPWLFLSASTFSSLVFLSQ